MIPQLLANHQAIAGLIAISAFVVGILTVSTDVPVCLAAFGVMCLCATDAVVALWKFTIPAGLILIGAAVVVASVV
jgi:hypothetical protein